MTSRQLFEGPGFQLSYPADWDFLSAANGEQFEVTLQSPGSIMWTGAALDIEADLELDDLIENAVDVFRVEYDDVDEYPLPPMAGPHPNLAREMSFMVENRLVAAVVYAIAAGPRTCVITFQGLDTEIEAERELLDQLAWQFAGNPEPFADGDDDLDEQPTP
jgi:hypothetical protein